MSISLMFHPNSEHVMIHLGRYSYSVSIITPCNHFHVRNCTIIVTSQINHPKIWIGWQQGCKQVSWIGLDWSALLSTISSVPCTSWMSWNRILCSTIVKGIHLTAVLRDFILFVRHCSAIHNKLAHGILQWNLWDHKITNIKVTPPSKYFRRGLVCHEIVQTKTFSRKFWWKSQTDIIVNHNNYNFLKSDWF